MVENIERAQKQLQNEENFIQKGLVPPEEIPQALERITGYLLKVETLINEKASLLEKLTRKQ